MSTIFFVIYFTNQTQIFADSVLAQPFATLMNAMKKKWLNQTENFSTKSPCKENINWNIQKAHLFLIMFTQYSYFQIFIKSKC